MRAGIVLQSETEGYRVLRPLSASGNVFEVRTLSGEQSKLIVRIYDCDEVHKFQNEVEKLQLLSQIMEDMGVNEQGFLIKVIE